MKYRTELRVAAALTFLLILTFGVARNSEAVDHIEYTNVGAISWTNSEAECQGQVDELKAKLKRKRRKIRKLRAKLAEAYEVNEWLTGQLYGAWLYDSGVAQ